MKFGFVRFVMARDLNQLVLAKAEGNFGSYLLCNTFISGYVRTLFCSNKLVWHLRVVYSR